ncbi:hypothetical protein PIB30_014434 [Stylosanthes scabra]|uniref:Uncharacterized protein n=1 Tax=Stylosanthes scabra TaxID=79078 RepID=A0ABU6V7L0_9FABA|nr:hypothetical protein [Stylosanthes scabra]
MTAYSVLTPPLEAGSLFVTACFYTALLSTKDQHRRSSTGPKRQIEEKYIEEVEPYATNQKQDREDSTMSRGGEYAVVTSSCLFQKRVHGEKLELQKV